MTVSGELMMAAADRGVCFVQFGDDDDTLLEDLAREFPKASLIPAGLAAAAPLDEWMAALAEHLAGAPRAVRAAASACAANRLAVLVPCHRALRADGGLG